MVDFICRFLAERFDNPCDYSDDERDYCDIMNEDDWCEQNCGTIDVAECWKRFFELMKAREDNGN